MNRKLERPLVLVHGLWNTPTLFRRLKDRLDQPESYVMSPHLPHRFGRVIIRQLATELDYQINKTFAPDTTIDLLGFSMGGIISRVWLQEMNGFKRTCRFFSIGCPHNGTLTAQLVPSAILPGVADMKLGSQLIKSLNQCSKKLKNVECRSYFSYLDLMVFPGFKGVLPYGPSIPLPVLTHKCLIKDSRSIEIISRDLLV